MGHPVFVIKEQIRHIRCSIRYLFSGVLNIKVTRGTHVENSGMKLTKTSKDGAVKADSFDYKRKTKDSNDFSLNDI